MVLRVRDNGALPDVEVDGFGGANPILRILAFAQRVAGGAAATTRLILRTNDPTQDVYNIVADADTFTLSVGTNVDPNSPSVRDFLSYDYSADTTTLGRPITAAHGVVLMKQVVFTETSGSGTYTGSITLPAGATLVDIKCSSDALWIAATSARLDVGDSNVPTGWFEGVNLTATDLLVGEEISFNQTGGKPGAYLSTATGKRTYAYNAAAYTVVGKVSAVGSGAAGVTRMRVLYSVPLSIAATKVTS